MFYGTSNRVNDEGMTVENQEITLTLFKMKFDLLITESQLNMSTEDFKKAVTLYKEFKKYLAGEKTLESLVKEEIL